MNKNITKVRIRMLLVILFTFFSVKLVVPNLFLANSPKINPAFIANIIDVPKEIASMSRSYLSSLGKFNFSINTNYVSNPDIKTEREMIAKIRFVTPPQSIIFKYVSKGVSAAEDQNSGEKYIKVESGTKYHIIGTVTVNGKQYPKIEFIE